MRKLAVLATLTAFAVLAVSPAEAQYSKDSKKTLGSRASAPTAQTEIERFKAACAKLGPPSHSEISGKTFRFENGGVGIFYEEGWYRLQAASGRVIWGCWRQTGDQVKIDYTWKGGTVITNTIDMKARVFKTPSNREIRF